MPENLSKINPNIERRVVEKRTGAATPVRAPQVSVVIPCYNNSALIAETLQTVFAQTFRDYEVVLVNDGSPDTTELEANLAPFSDEIIYVRQRNHGAAAARNTGIYYSRGRLIAFLDADDLWFPEYLAEQTKFLRAKNFQMVYADALLFGRKSWEGKTYMQTTPSRGAVTTAKLISTECSVITSGTIVEKEQIERRGGFDESAEAARVEDFELWVGLAKQGCRIGYQRKVLLKYRVGYAGLSGGNVSRAERSVRALHLIKEKNDLTAAELSAWHEQLKRASAQLELERGKFHLVRENFELALLHLTKANEFYRKKKLYFLIWLIKNKPFLVKNIYKTLRADEFEGASLPLPKAD